MVNLHFGYVTNIDSNGRVRVIIPDLDDFTTDYMPVLRSKAKHDKDGNTLDINEEVALLLNQNGDCGVILGAVSSDSTALPYTDRDKKYYEFKDGTKFEYDRKEHKYSANIKGNVSVKAKNIDFDAQNINLGTGGRQIARIGDSVQVDLATGKGTITSGGKATSI